MTIELPADLEKALTEYAAKINRTPEAVALSVLRAQFGLVKVPVPRDEWEKALLAIATDCGVSLPDEALTREALYDD